MDFIAWKETLDFNFVEVPNRKMPAVQNEEDIFERTFYYPKPFIDRFLDKLDSFTIDEIMYKVTYYKTGTSEQMKFIITYQDLTIPIFFEVRSSQFDSRFTCYYFLKRHGGRDLEIDEETKETVDIIYQDMIAFVQEYSPNRLHFQVNECKYDEPNHQEWR